MSASSALQKAIVAAMKANAGIAALVGVRIYDEAPVEPVYPYISLGPTSFFTNRQDCFKRRTETVQIDIWDRSPARRQPCKAICDAIVAALDAAKLSLDDPYALARIDLVLARFMDDPDGIAKHGVLQFTCEVTG